MIRHLLRIFSHTRCIWPGCWREGLLTVRTDRCGIECSGPHGPVCAKHASLSAALYVGHGHTVTIGNEQHPDQEPLVLSPERA